MKRMSDKKIKNQRKYLGVLRSLAKSDSSIYNKLKITVSEGEFVDEKEQILIAPSMYKSCPENLVNQNINPIPIGNKIEITKEEKEISDENGTETLDYPDSSDFSDDE